MSIPSPRLESQLSQSQPSQRDPERKPSTLIDHIAALKNHFAQIHQQLADTNARLNSLEARSKQKEETLVKLDEELSRKIAEISQELARKIGENSEEIRKLNEDQDKRTSDARQKLNDDMVKIGHLTEELGQNLRELKSTFHGGMTKLNETKLNRAEFDSFKDELGHVLGKLVTSLEESFIEYSEAEQAHPAEQVHMEIQQPKQDETTALAASSSPGVESDILKVRLLKDEDKDKRKFSWWK